MKDWAVTYAQCLLFSTLCTLGPSGGTAGRGDPPTVLGDGMNLWEQLSGAKPWSSSPRTELL